MSVNCLGASYCFRCLNHTRCARRQQCRMPSPPPPPQPPSHPPLPLLPGWVVTWFLLGYTLRMFEYTVRTFWSNVGRFLYVFSSIPRKLYTIFQPTFSPIKRYQESIFKFLTLSTNSVTNAVRTAYFQIQARSSPLKKIVTESVLKVRSFIRISWHR